MKKRDDWQEFYRQQVEAAGDLIHLPRVLPPRMKGAELLPASSGNAEGTDGAGDPGEREATPEGQNVIQKQGLTGKGSPEEITKGQTRANQTIASR